MLSTKRTSKRQPNGGAIKAGIQMNDVITKIGNRRIEATRQLQEIIARARPGERLPLTIIRDGKERTITVTLTARTEKGPGTFPEE
jgi:S1-C subfamily serine protease